MCCFVWPGLLSWSCAARNQHVPNRAIDDGEGMHLPTEPEALVRLPDLANKNTGHSIKSEFQINNE